MKTMRRIAGIAVLMTITGCATLISGPRQRVQVTSFPAEATVRVDGVTATTPAEIKLSRRHGYEVEFSKAGYVPAVVHLERRLSISGLLASAVFTGGLSLVVDFVSGAAFELDPALVSVTLAPDPGSRGPEGTRP